MNFSALFRNSATLHWVNRMSNDAQSIRISHKAQQKDDSGCCPPHLTRLVRRRASLRFFTNKLITGRHFLGRRRDRTRRETALTHPFHNNFACILDFQPIPDGTSNVSYLPAIRLTGTIVHVTFATDRHIRTSANRECSVLSISRAIGYRSIRRCW